MEQALSDLNVVDLTHFIAGPYCTKLLADFGAEVIKVERPGQGDRTRAIGPFSQDDANPEKSGLFHYLNTNKKSITLNLESKSGAKIFQELVKGADIVVENFEPRVMPSLGLSYEVLKEINPRLIMTSISNFGQTGPYRDYKATNLTMLAIGGALCLTGDKDHPFKLGGSQAEYMAGLVAFIATLSALHGRDASGTGQYIDLSIMEAVASNLEAAPISYTYMGVIRQREFNRFIYGHPYGIYPCKDGHIVVIPGLGGMPTLAILLEKPEYEDHPLFTDHRARQERAEEFDAMMLPWLKEHDKQYIVELAQELRMPFGPVQTTEELLEDPQLKAREFFAEVEHPVMGKLTCPGAPFKMSETPWQAGRAPLLGEHNEEIYGKRLGYTKDDLVRLREDEAI